MAKSKRLVIDACVARASGPPGSTHHTSSNCRKFLEGVRRICHRMILTQAIADEWNKHQSRFARSWRVSMHARKKIEFIDITEDKNLRDRITKLVNDDFVLKIILKDMHLVEAAIYTDRCIVSLETSSFGHLRLIASEIKEIAQLALVNPDEAVQDPIGWLEAGAPISGAYKLLKPVTEE
jgi:hypothetical protein